MFGKKPVPRNSGAPVPKNRKSLTFNIDTGDDIVVHNDEDDVDDDIDDYNSENEDGKSELELLEARLNDPA